MTNKPLLELNDLSVSFRTRRGTLKAVDGVSLTLSKGEILGLVGESGAGKSMTGAAVMGLIDPPGKISGGEIWYDGQRIDQRPELIRGRHISMVFQDPLTSLNPLKTVGEQLTETISRHLDVSAHEAQERAKQGLADVGIDPLRFSAYPHSFSGGMRQRVVIALALSTEPKVIIADEPTTALDVSVQAQILDLLKSLCAERGTAVILITHDMGVIAETTDRVAVLYAGRMAEIGDTAEVLKAPVHPYTKGLMASTPTISLDGDQGFLHQIPGAMPKLDAIPPGCAFNPRCEFSMERCRQEVPSMIGGRAACWLGQEAGT